MSATQGDGSSTFSQSAPAVAARLRVSALADGELDAIEAQGVVDTILASPDLEAYWTELHRAGDCLRSEEVAGVGDGGAFLRRFAGRLADEPAIAAPLRYMAARSPSRSWLRAGLPGASIAAALLVVAWMVMPFNRNHSVDQTLVQADAVAARATTVASSAVIAAPAALEPVAVQPVDPQQLADYLAAHQQLASSAFRGPSLLPASFSTSRLEPAQSAQPR